MRFRHTVAGPGRRALAWAIDAAIRLVVLVIVGVALLLVSFSMQDLAEVSAGFILLLLFLLEWFYGLAFEVLMRGQTPGKAALSLRVVRVDGAPAGVQVLVLRNLLRGADLLPVWGLPFLPQVVVPTFAVGVGVMLLDSKLRRLGDIVGGTIVIYESAERISDVGPIEPPLSDEERQSLPVSVVLSREERRIIEDFVRRRRTLGPSRAEELAEKLAPSITSRSGIEAPTATRVLVLAYAALVGRSDA